MTMTTISDDVHSALIYVLLELAGYDIETHVRDNVHASLPGGPGTPDGIPAEKEFVTQWNTVADWLFGEDHARSCGYRIDWDALVAEERERAQELGIAFPSPEELNRIGA
jgi:hypothetical protein